MFQKISVYPKNKCIGRDYHDFVSKIFGFIVLKTFIWQLFCVSPLSGIENCKGQKRALVSCFAIELYCLKVPKDFVEESLFVCFIRVSKILCITRGYHDFLSYILCHSTEEFRMGNILCCQETSALGKIAEKKGWEEGGSIRNVSRKYFLSQCQNFFLGEAFGVLVKLANRNFLCVREVDITILNRSFFCLTLPKLSYGKSSVFQET